MADDMMHYIAGHTGFGNGIAGAAQGAIASIPGIGGALTSTTMVTIPGIGVSIASGVLVSLAASATIGIGGILLANWMEKHETPDDKIHWSKIVRYASLTTSILIALPSILSGISMGITFLAAVMNPLWGSYAADAMRTTIGATTMPMNGLSGAAAVLPHLLTCGFSLLPVGLASFMSGHKAPDVAKVETLAYDGRVATLPQMTFASH